MTESEIWQIIQTGNEISVLRTELFITITVGVLIAGMIQIHTMALEGQDISLMGRFLAGLLDSPSALPVVPALQFLYWFVTVSTVSYSIWMYRRQSQ